MSKTIDIDPITRIEGHLAINIKVEDGRVIYARSSGEMFRGFEIILKGRDPLDAQQITQRICGVCPISHGTASILAQDMAYGIRPPENGRLARNIILAANYIQSHLIHFYQLSALDFVDIAAVTSYRGNDPMLKALKAWVESQISSKTIFPAAPFLPRFDSTYIENNELNILAIKHYLEAIEMRAMAHKMGAVFGAKLPHSTTLVPGGVTEKITARKIATCRDILKKLSVFIENAYIPDVIEVASSFPDYFSTGKGCGNFLAYGVFPESNKSQDTCFPSGVLTQGKLSECNPDLIYEDVKYSLYSNPSGLKPQNGATVPFPGKKNAYTWLKAPRYNREVMEVGPLARMLVAYNRKNNKDLNTLIDNLLKKFDAGPDALISTMGRHAARALEAKIIADRCAQWIEQLIPDKPSFTDFEIPESGRGVGLTEAPRGALGHWINIKGHKIENYQCVVPTTWNCSPRDDRDIPGPVEQALIGTEIKDHKNPIEATRVVRSFDPCIACAVH